ncbi:MAG TPA: hypothetical protein VK325_12910 [Pseudoxanthomonas sp.]|nr:hypothetical protein [Pseudoxanthomonas sp.]
MRSLDDAQPQEHDAKAVLENGCSQRRGAAEAIASQRLAPVLHVVSCVVKRSPSRLPQGKKTPRQCRGIDPAQ